MPLNNTENSPFVWDPTPHSDQPPDNIQSGDYMLASKINEIKDNADYLHDNLEYCFSEELTFCSQRETDRFEANYEINYAEDYDDRFSGNQSTDFSDNNSTRWNTRYYNKRYSVREAYCDARRGIDNSLFIGCFQVFSNKNYTVQSTQNYSRQSSYESGNYSEEQLSVFTNEYDTHDDALKSTVKNQVRDNNNSAENITVCLIN